MSLQNAYQSKVIKGFSVSNIALAIEKASITDKSPVAAPGINYVTELQDVPPFPYPVYNHDNNETYIDARPYSSIERDGTLKIRNTMDERLNLLCARLESAWNKCDHLETKQRAFSMADEVFVKWLSSTITHRYGLPPLQQTRMTALVALFSLGHYYNNVEDKLTLSRYLQQITRTHPVPLDIVTEVSDRIDGTFPRDVDEFISAIAKVDFGPRLSGFNSKALFTILNGSWWSTNNANIFVAIAVEYPPAMAALVEMAIENTMFKRTKIGGLVWDMNRGTNFSNYSRGLLMFMEQFE